MLYSIHSCIENTTLFTTCDVKWKPCELEWENKVGLKKSWKNSPILLCWLVHQVSNEWSTCFHKHFLVICSRIFVCFFFLNKLKHYFQLLFHQRYFVSLFDILTNYSCILAYNKVMQILCCIVMHDEYVQFNTFLSFFLSWR